MSCLAVASPNVADILTDVLEKKAEASTVQTPRDAEDTLEGHAESEGVIVGKVEAEAQGCHALGGGGGGEVTNGAPAESVTERLRREGAALRRQLALKDRLPYEDRGADAPHQPHQPHEEVTPLPQKQHVC
jgi:hypothetical protein